MPSLVRISNVSGASFTIDVTSCELSANLSERDFRVFHGSSEFTSFYTKTSQTQLTYSGAAVVLGTIVTIIRDTPLTAAETSFLTTTTAVELTNALDRLRKRCDELEALASGNLVNVNSLTTGLSDQQFGATWNGDTVQGATRNALYYATNSVKKYRNRLNNGDFQVWQRGDFFATGGVGVSQSIRNADRWRMSSFPDGGTSATVNINHLKPVDADGSTIGASDFWRATINTVGTSLGANSFAILERNDLIAYELGGKYVTFSFWARASFAKQLKVLMYKNYGTGGSPTASELLTNSDFTLNTNFTKYSVTFFVPGNDGKTFGSNNDANISIQFVLQAGNLGVNWGSTGYVDIGSVQLEEGYVATVFERESFSRAFTDCQGFYMKSYAYGVPAGTASAAGGCEFPLGAATTASVVTSVAFPKAMVRIPTITSYDDAGTAARHFRNGNGKSAQTIDLIWHGGFRFISTDTTSSARILFYWEANADF